MTKIIIGIVTHEEIINNKSISVLKKVEDMQFKHVLKNIKNVNNFKN